jgi:hypothetical protein
MKVLSCLSNRKHGEEPTMSAPIATERRILTDSEFDAVSRSHYPAISKLDRPGLVALARTVREFRDKARDVSRHRRRELRGKAEPRGAGAARDESGLGRKKQVFVSALKRVNREMTRQTELARPRSQGELSQEALAMHRASLLRHHPAPGRTADEGMRAVPSGRRRTRVDPRKVGSISQANKNAQARRDS